MALCAAAALAYAYMNEAQANQQLRDMLKVYDAPACSTHAAYRVPACFTIEL